jgi:hypothetical protein
MWRQPFLTQIDLEENKFSLVALEGINQEFAYRGPFL